ncbi:titin homolog isoform X1 [Scophthalmus maximus]|uniref:titin homolog isoform X1 n=1 Tax=Scophthalmus maximus TaxID=52904 RepID=UPI001FA84291|nr:titin homolog isoform X1 [Scophthalmus maximus]XP_035496026.2 titin homolog isoform X1 [Scophthalmus maximus]
MAAQVEVQTGEVGRTMAGGRLHLNPLTDSSNKGLVEINQSHIITPEPNKPVPGPKPRLTPKPYAVDRNPTIKPILAPKPQTKPRPESTRFVGYKPEPPRIPKPQQPVATVKPRPVSFNPNRPASTSFKTSNQVNTGQTTKPVVQPFKPAPPFDPGDPSKPTPPVPAERRKSGASSLGYSNSLKNLPAAEWSGTTKMEDEKDKTTSSKGGASITRAKSMGFLAQVGQEEEEKGKVKAEGAVPLRPQPRSSRPRPVSAIFLDSPTNTEAPGSSPRWVGRRPLSADLTSRFESIGLSLHRKSPKANTKENTPEATVLPQSREQERTPKSNTLQSADVVAKPALSDQSNKETEEMAAKESDENKRVVSIKSRISLLLDPSSTPGTVAAVQGSDLQSPVQLVPEKEPPVGVKKLIKQLTEDTPPTQGPIVKPTLRPRPLPLDLTKRFSSEWSPDFGSVPLSEATDHHDITKDPQRRNEELTPKPIDHRTFVDLKDSQEQLQKAAPPEGPEAGHACGATSEESGPSGEVQTVRASLFENVVERHSVQMVDEDKPVNKPKDLLRSLSFKRGSGEDEGTLVTATYKDPSSPPSPLRVSHAVDTVQAVEENRAVSENVPSAQWEDKAATLRSRRSEGSRRAVEGTGSAKAEPTLAVAPEPQTRYLRVGALPKWTTAGHGQDAGVDKGMLNESQMEGGLAVDKERHREAEQEEVAAGPKRLKMLQAEEQHKPRATYFALTGQMQEPVSPIDAGAHMGDTLGPFDDFSVRAALGGSQGKILPVRRNPSLDEAFGKNAQDQSEEQMRSHVSHNEIRSALDGQTAEDAMELGKKRETKKHKGIPRDLQREKQRQLEIEKQAHLEFARMKEREMQREFERERQKAFEKEKQEFEKKQRALERQRQIELEKQRLQELEREKQRELEREWQQQLEKERRQQLEREIEREKLQEQERERQREQERQRQREEERQRELDKERRLLEIQKEKQKMEELERQQLLEFQRQKQREKERQQLVELEKHRIREKMEREEAEKIKQMALEQEMLRLKELDRERERQREMEKAREKEMEREKQRELERQRQLDAERQELENQRSRQQEKERQRREELVRLMEMERRRLLEFEKQKQAEKDRQQLLEFEKRRLKEKLEREEADKMRQVAKQQEAERQRLKEKQKKEEQDRARSESSPLRPKVLDLDSVLRNEPFPKAASQRSDLATRWKEPSPRVEESYKPAILDIDAFTSQTQSSPSRDLVSGIQGVEAGFGARLLPTPEREISWKVPSHTSVGFSSPVWTQSPQDPWELRPVEMSVDKPVAETRKPSHILSPEQLLLRQGERLLSPQRHWSAPVDDPIHPAPFPSIDAKPGGAPGAVESSAPADQMWSLSEAQPHDSRGEVWSQRRSQGSQELNRMRSRSVSRRSAPSSSSVETSLSRMRSRSAHRERDRHSSVQQKQNLSGEEEGDDDDSETRVRDTDSQYGTWETGLRTDDSLTPATPSSESNLSPSPRKHTPPHTPGDHPSQFDSDALDGLLPRPSSDSQPLSFPEAPTALLDTSALRSRAQLVKKRAPRTRPTRAARQSAALPEGGDGTTEDWLYRDSTEAKVEGKEDDWDPEGQTRGAPPAAASQPQRVALFPGMDPSALKAQLRKRGDSDNQSNGPTPSPSQLSRSPKSPFLPRAARVLPPPGGKENGEEDSPQWLKELKSKKRLSQYENDS